MKKEKFNELIREVQNASTGKLGKISPEIRDHMHQLYESFKKEVAENINAIGYNAQTYVYLTGLIFELSEHKRKTSGFPGIFTTNNVKSPIQSNTILELKKNTQGAKYVQPCNNSN